MNCSEALLDAVAKYAFEIGLKPLRSIEKTEGVRTNEASKELLLLQAEIKSHLLLLAETIFVVQKLERVKDVLHGDKRICKVLQNRQISLSETTNRSFCHTNVVKPTLTYVFVHLLIKVSNLKL